MDMKRCDRKNHSQYEYSDKKSFVRDFCDLVQRLKKEYKESGNSAPFLIRVKMNLVIGSHIEWWEFTLTVGKKIVFNKCVASVGEWNGLKRIAYCCNPDCNGKLDNEFDNVKEIREFLNREVGKELE